MKHRPQQRKGFKKGGFNYFMEEGAPIRRLKRTLTTENLWLYLLSLLSKKEGHGYTFGKQIKRRYGWRPGLITPYVVLYRLEAEGYIKSHQRGRRVTYSITLKGKKALAEAKVLLKELGGKL
jgi:DNA-binding PadR family transcriptional regulator